MVSDGGAPSRPEVRRVITAWRKRRLMRVGENLQLPTKCAAAHRRIEDTHRRIRSGVRRASETDRLANGITRSPAACKTCRLPCAAPSRARAIAQATRVSRSPDRFHFRLIVGGVRRRPRAPRRRGRDTRCARGPGRRPRHASREPPAPASRLHHPNRADRRAARVTARTAGR